MVDVTGGANAAIRGAGFLANVNQANRARSDARTGQVVGAFEGGLKRGRDASERAKGLEGLKALGRQLGIPEDSPAWGHPQSAMLAIEQGFKQQQSRTDYERDVGRDERRFEQQGELMGRRRTWQETDRADDRAFDLADREREIAEKTSERKRKSGFLAGLIAPEQAPEDVVAPFGAPPRQRLTERAPTGEDMMRRFRDAPEDERDADVLETATGFLPKEARPAQPPKWNDTPEGYRTQKEIDREFETPKAPAQTDDEKIEFAVKKAKALLAVKGPGQDPAELRRITDTLTTRRGKIGLIDRLEADIAAAEAEDGPAGRTRAEAAFRPLIKRLQGEIAGAAPPAAAGGASGPTPAELAEMDAAGMRWDPATQKVVPK